MNLGTLGELLVKIKAENVKETDQQLRGVQKTTKDAGNESKRQVPVLERMGRRWGAVLGIVATSGAVAFGLIAKSSPAVMGSLKGIQLAFEDIFNTIGEELSPVFDYLEEKLFGVSEWFNNLPEPVKTFASALVGAAVLVGALAAGFVAVSAAGPLVVAALGAVGVGLGGAILILSTVVVWIALLYVAWKYNIFGIRDKTHAFISWMKERWSKLMAIILDENKTTWEKVKGVMGWLWETAKEIFGKIKDVIVGNIMGAKDLVLEAFADMKDALRKTIEFFTSNPITLHKSRANLEGRASGGPVIGGTPYIVGEVGPELFVPSVSGSIVPNNKLSSSKQAGSTGGSTTPINMNIRVELDGRKVWESVRKYSAAELRNRGAY